MNDTRKMIWKIDSIISYVVESEMEGKVKDGNIQFKP